MRWRLAVFLVLTFIGVGVGYLGGYLAHDPKYYAVSALLFFVSVDVILLAITFAQDDGAEGQKKINRSTE